MTFTMEATIGAIDGPPELRMLELGDDPIRAVEKATILAFVRESREHLTGSVLDYGCGKCPYINEIPSRDYKPWDIDHKADRHPMFLGKFDAILCTQVLQYIEDWRTCIWTFREWLNPGGK